MANEFERDLTDLRGVSIDEVESAGILGIGELPQFQAAIEQNFEGEKQDVLMEVAEGIEESGQVPESAVDPDQKAREPEPGNPESIRKRLAGEAGTPSDEYGFKTREDALFTELVAASDLESRNEDDAFIQVAGEADEVDAPLTQEQVNVEGERVEKAREYNQEERSARARDVDDNYNAPVTTDYEKWQENPNRLDFPGVDTIPAEKRQQRAATFAANAQEAGLVENFEIGTGLFGESSPGTRGSASGSTVEVDTSRAFDAAETLAHEVGHKVEEQVRDRESSLFMGDSDEQAAETLTTQLRGKPDDAYRESDSERFADAVAATVLSPRRAKRDAPAFVESLQDRLPEDERSLFTF